MSRVNNRALPFADAASIVRAHQKDTYYEASIRSHLQSILQSFKGQRFINTYTSEVTVASKALYLFLTTVMGSRTLGEEYVDLIYVVRSGKRLPKLLSRLGFVLSYALIPYLISRLVKKIRNQYDENKAPAIIKFFSDYKNLLDVILNLHVALFYFNGQFYSLSKRIFGLRYALGHNKDVNDLKKFGNYSILGIIILLQFVVKGLLKLKSYNDDMRKVKKAAKSDTWSHINSIDQLKEIEFEKKIDLSNEKVLPYIPADSRDCMFCVSPMENPAAALCGHIFCWNCILDWLRDNGECPLCRQNCAEQNLLPLR